MGCTCDVNNPTTYLGCAGDIVRAVAPQSVMTQYAAGAGASSANYSMCLAMMFLNSRRMEYWKVTPGDCGSPGTQVLGSTFQVETGVLKGLGTAAAVDPEPISKGILAGVAAIFGGFTAHHAQAVATEQQTLCGVTNSFNYVLQQLETAVMSGQISAQGAANILQQAFQQLQGNLNAIKSGQNAAWGYQIAMTALNNFEQEIVFPILAESITGAPANAPPPQPQPTFGNPSASAVTPWSPAMPQPVAPPLVVSNLSPGMNANNSGVGPLSAPFIPNNLPIGQIVLIGGVAFVVGKAL